MTDRQRHIVAEADAGERLDRWLAGVAGVSRSRAARAIADGRVTLDDEVATSASRRLAPGQVVVLAPEPPAPTVEPPAVPPIRFDDEHLLVVAKPSGLVVHPGVGHAGDTLVDALLAAGTPLADATDERRPGIVHRLDRDTSGLLAIAKSAVALDGLARQLRARTVRRRYLALTDLAPPAPRGRVDAPLARHRRERQRFDVDPSGRHAVTHWTTLGTGDAAGGRGVALVGCRLETGRTHQIRVHLRHLGCPVVADPLYGRAGDARVAVRLDRLGLHAAALGFEHPADGTRVDLVEPLPDDLRDAVASIAWRDDVLDRAGAWLEAG